MSEKNELTHSAQERKSPVLRGTIQDISDSNRDGLKQSVPSWTRRMPVTLVGCEIHCKLEPRGGGGEGCIKVL